MVEIKGRKRKINQWMALYLDGALEIATMRLRGRDSQVLFVMFAWIEFSGCIYISQSKIAQILGMSIQAVSVSIKNLIEKGILLLVNREGKCNCYKIAPEIGYMGTRSVGKFRALKRRRRKKMVVDKDTGEILSE